MDCRVLAIRRTDWASLRQLGIWLALTSLSSGALGSASSMLQTRTATGKGNPTV